MDQHLHVLFGRVLGDEPLPPPGDLAQEAMAGGRRLRRRRRLVVGGAAAVVTVLAAVGAVNLATTPPPAPALLDVATAPDCARLESAPAEAAILLRSDITDQQRFQLDRALRADRLVAQVRYESKEAAYEKFKQMYRDAPDLLAAVKPDQMDDSFRVTLADRSQHWALREAFADWPGVQTVVGGHACATSPGEHE